MPVGVIPDISLSEVDFLYAAIGSGIREDGRGLNDFRQASIEFGDDWGKVNIKLGETR